MAYTGIIIAFAFVLAWILVQCIKSFENDDALLYKVLGILIAIMASGILFAFSIGMREEIRHQTLEDYFNGKIEVIESQQTVRTYKQIK